MMVPAICGDRSGGGPRMVFIFAHPAILVLLAAAGYGGAAVALRAAAVAAQGWLIWLVVIGLSVAALAEFALLRQLRLNVAYLAVLSVETLMVLACAFLLGEDFGAREAAGAVLILGGTLVLVL